MSTHHVSRRVGGAILVVILGVVVVAGSVDVAAAPNCQAWVAATNRANERAGQNRTREATIKALAQACSPIPEHLRRAARAVQKMKDPTEREATLGAAASADLDAGCVFDDPHANALTAARACPLPPLPPTFPFRLDEAELARLGAVDYLILNVLMRSLLAANELDESARLLLLEFTLSAEIAREDLQKRAERRHGRSR